MQLLLVSSDRSRALRAPPRLPASDLPPFALWTALPPPDYYGGSVTLRVAPVRSSRASLRRYIEPDLGSPLIPFIELTARRPDTQRLRRSRHETGAQVSRVFRCCNAGPNFSHWGLGFKQSSLCHIRRVSPRNGLSTSTPFAAFLACSCPLNLSAWGEPDDSGMFL